MPLFNLPETAQEIYDIVASHMLRQNEKSHFTIRFSVLDSKPLWAQYDSAIIFHRCAYRGTNGLKCAAGCLIPEEIYKSDFEGVPWTSLIHSHDFPQDHRKLIENLQHIHDSFSVDRWHSALIDLAQMYSLNTDVLNTI
jgi:hypothetical protein